MEFYVPGRYIPGEIMGSGARGIVMKAFDKKNNNLVAIKRLHYLYNEKLLTGKLLFNGEDQEDQLMLIFKIIKIQFNNLSLEMKYILSIYDYTDRLSESSGSDMEKLWEELLPNSVFPENESNNINHDKHQQSYESLARDLISKMLTIDDNQRISAEESLKHDFLHPYSSFESPDNSEKIDLNQLLETGELNSAQWNQLIFTKVKEFESEQLRLNNDIETSHLLAEATSC
uniref:Protein kinase domain-containing protein n=1 Tax=Acrobeloides nanus TaxID=290746 RepID=A0A914CBC5_9BILA